MSVCTNNGILLSNRKNEFTLFYNLDGTELKGIMLSKVSPGGVVEIVQLV